MNSDPKRRIEWWVRDFGDCLNWKVCGYCLNWKVCFLKSLFLEKFVSLESEKMKERMKKFRLYVEEKMKNEEWRDEENRKKDN